jgi:hypothetical protein
MAKKKTNLSLSFALWWTVSSLAVFALSLVIVFPAMMVTDTTTFNLSYYQLTALLIGIPGAAIALGQYLVLKRQVPVSRWWILAGAVGLAAAVVSQEAFSTGDVTMGLFPLIAGGAQSYLLRDLVSRAWLWLLINLLIFVLIAGLNLAGLQLGAMPILFTYSVLSGLGMYWLLKQK